MIQICQVENGECKEETAEGAAEELAEGAVLHSIVAITA